MEFIICAVNPNDAGQWRADTGSQIETGRDRRVHCSSLVGTFSCFLRQVDCAGLNYANLDPVAHADISLCPADMLF